MWFHVSDDPLASGDRRHQHHRFYAVEGEIFFVPGNLGPIKNDEQRGPDLTRGIKDQFAPLRTMAGGEFIQCPTQRHGVIGKIEHDFGDARSGGELSSIGKIDLAHHGHHQQDHPHRQAKREAQ